MRSLAIFPACIILVLTLAAPSAAFVRGTAPQPLIGIAFPDFTLPDVDGRMVTLSDFQGKAILLSFWSCYTDTCFTSASILEKLIGELGDKGLVALTVCSEIPPALEKDNYDQLLKRCGAGQIVLIDAKKKITGKHKIRRFPTTWLIGRDYRIRDKIVGVPPLREDEFTQKVRFLVDEPMAEEEKERPPGD